jgi:hypothetical protein
LSKKLVQIESLLNSLTSSSSSVSQSASETEQNLAITALPAVASPPPLVVASPVISPPTPTVIATPPSVVVASPVISPPKFSFFLFGVSFKELKFAKNSNY